MRSALLCCLLLAPAAVSQEAPVPHPDDVAAGIPAAVEFLLTRQERYEPDKRVGRLQDDELIDWQQREEERLATLRQTGPGAEWPYEGVYRVGGIIPGGYRVGGSAIVSLALMRAPGLEDDPRRREAITRALEFVLVSLEGNPQLEPGPKSGYDVRGWGHAYGLRFLLEAEARGLVPAAHKEQVVKAIPHLLHCLAVNAQPNGGWNYADDQRVSPFMTGSTLLTLYLARERGHAVDAEMITKALSALKRSRTESVAYAYAGNARGEVAMPGSSARSSVAELALYLAGESDQAELRKAVNGFFHGWNDLLDRKSKQGTHEGTYGIAPYYFFFGHTYAAIAIEQLPAEERPALRQRMQAVLWDTREDGGQWNDRIFPRSSAYSTAMCLLALLAPEGPSFPRWRK